jgi:rare lipoprotein A
MQTKLRKVSRLFVVSLKANVSKAHPAPRPRYTGVASWYGADRQGRKMANGRKFDRRALTAACWYFPLGTVLHVVNLNTGKAVTVTVTDRGPNLRLNRVVDLSEAAAERLGYIGNGLTRVAVTPIFLAKPEHAEFDVQLAEPFSEAPLVAAAVPVPNRPN